MPYRWLPREGEEGEAEELHLWPHRSLSAKGFVGFIALTSGLLAMPLLSVLGTPVLWGLLPFLVVTIGLLWLALRRNDRDRDLLEVLRITPATITLEQRPALGSGVKRWQANPYWVRVTDHGSAGPVVHYLTLEGGPRPVEIGRFLTVEERLRLKDEITRKLAALREAHDFPARQ